ncbi:DALR anticodon-binding domain-containing protein [Micromonospora zamorensis]|uniref:DALR anticodon-binding domain-containing protein n=1 Tax=Micromonospora zamorensis TaxID=709883 RepID=UPI003797EC64
MPTNPPTQQSPFDDALTEVTATYEPHRLCGYLYRLAQTFTTFYEHCPVLRADPVQRGNRLALCQLTGDTLRTGLQLLGIDAPDQL